MLQASSSDTAHKPNPSNQGTRNQWRRQNHSASPANILSRQLDPSSIESSPHHRHGKCTTHSIEHRRHLRGPREGYRPNTVTACHHSSQSCTSQSQATILRIQRRPYKGETRLAQAPHNFNTCPHRKAGRHLPTGTNPSIRWPVCRGSLTEVKQPALTLPTAEGRHTKTGVLILQSLKSAQDQAYVEPALAIAADQVSVGKASHTAPFRQALISARKVCGKMIQLCLPCNLSQSDT